MFTFSTNSVWSIQPRLFPHLDKESDIRWGMRKRFNRKGFFGDHANFMVDFLERRNRGCRLPVMAGSSGRSNSSFHDRFPEVTGALDRRRLRLRENGGFLMNNVTDIAMNEPRPEARLLRPELEKLAAVTHPTHASVDAKIDRCIALVESRAFVRECMRRGMQPAFSQPVMTFSTLSELESHFSDAIALVFLCLADTRHEECARTLKILSDLNPSIPVVVHATVNDIDLAKTAINFGAKGYIPCTENFEMVNEAVRFILAGGTYIPVDYLFDCGPGSPRATQGSPLTDTLTERERSVVKALQEGKSNKIIAYKLGLSEGTVKVHLRNIMRKLKAKNRTEVAIKSQTLIIVDRVGPT